MPTNHKDNSSDGKLKKSVPNRSKNTPVINITVNSGVNQVGSIDTKTIENNQQESHIEINIVDEPTDYTHQIEANRIASDANKISNKSVWVNRGLFIGTIILVIISTCQSYYASKSVVLADSVFKATKSFNDSTLKLQQNAFIKSVKDGKTADSLNDSTSDRQKRGIEAQITALNQTQKEFAIGNEPYLQYFNNATNFPNSGFLVFTPKVLNYGRYPVIVTNYNIAYTFTELTDKKFSKICSKFTEENLVSINFPWPISSDTIKGDFYTNVMTDTLFIRGEIFYKDLIKNKRKKYSFKIKYVNPDAQYFYGRKDEFIK